MEKKEREIGEEKSGCSRLRLKALGFFFLLYLNYPGPGFGHLG